MLDKRSRLTSSRDFKHVFSTGRTYINKAIILKVLPVPDNQHGKFGFTTSAKLGNSVVRNRIKRLLREAIRISKDSLKQSGYYAVIIARPGIKGLSFVQILQYITEALDKAGLLINTDKSHN